MQISFFRQQIKLPFDHLIDRLSKFFQLLPILLYIKGERQTFRFVLSFGATHSIEASLHLLVNYFLCFLNDLSLGCFLV